MRPSRRHVFPFVFFMLGCGPTVHEESHSDIYGGIPVLSGARLSAVALTENGRVFCTGTAVTPRLVITAAHCVTDDLAENMKVYVGEGEEEGNYDGQYEVEKIAFNPRYRPDNVDLGFDAAYLLLKSDLDLPPEAYIPILLDPLEMAELYRGGTPSYLVGFGTRKKQMYGVKYEVKASVRNYQGVEISIGGSGRDACQGDSGGPAYGQLTTGEWRVYGVTSRGGNCGNGGIWGLMHANVCWIQADSGVNLNLPREYCEGTELSKNIKVKFSKLKKSDK